MNDKKPNISDISVIKLPANDTFSLRLNQALTAVRHMAAAESIGKDKLEIITDLMRGPNGATVEDVVAVTGWPLGVVQSALITLVGILPGAEESTEGTQKLYRITGWEDNDKH